MNDQIPDIAHIEVTGEAELPVEPDIAYIETRLKNVADSPSVAKEEVDRRSSAVIELARSCGIGDADITATRLEITPEYDWRADVREYKGTSVSRDIQVVLRDLESYPKFVQGLADVPVQSLSDVTMDTTRRDELEEEALADAIANATKIAKAMARGLGQEITGVFRAANSDRPYSRGVVLGELTSGARNSFEIGTIKVAQYVKIIFAIRPKNGS